MITFSPHEQQKLLRDWHRHRANLQAAFEPAYQVRPQLPTITDSGRKFLLTSWLNGRPSILPPADVVALTFYDPATSLLQGYLINQPELFELLGPLLSVEVLPTRLFQVETLTTDIRRQIMSQAQLQSETLVTLDAPARHPASQLQPSPNPFQPAPSAA